MEAPVTGDEYRGHEIRYNQDHRFTIVGPHLNTQGSLGFDSYRQACEAIDEAIKTFIKGEERKIEIPVIGMSGNLYQDLRVVALTIRGINAGNQDMLFAEKLDNGRRPSNVYPSHPAIRDLLYERQKLLKKTKEIDKLLEPFGMSTSRGYGRIGKSEKMLAAINEMISEHLEKQNLAIQKFPIETP